MFSGIASPVTAARRDEAPHQPIRQIEGRAGAAGGPGAAWRSHATHSHKEQMQPQSPLQLLCEPPNTSPQNPVRQKQTTLDSTLPAHAKRAHVLAEAEANEAEPSTPAAEQTRQVCPVGSCRATANKVRSRAPQSWRPVASAKRTLDAENAHGREHPAITAFVRSTELQSRPQNWPSAQRKLQFHAAV